MRSIVLIEDSSNGMSYEGCDVRHVFTLSLQWHQVDKLRVAVHNPTHFIYGYHRCSTLSL